MAVVIMANTEIGREIFPPSRNENNKPKRHALPMNLGGVSPSPVSVIQPGPARNKTGVVGALCAPIRAGDKIIGTRREHKYSAAEINTLQSIAAIGWLRKSTATKNAGIAAGGSSVPPNCIAA